MLATFYFSTVLVTDVHTEDISDIVCQTFHYLIQQYHDEKEPTFMCDHNDYI